MKDFNVERLLKISMGNTEATDFLAIGDWKEFCKQRCKDCEKCIKEEYGQDFCDDAEMYCEDIRYCYEWGEGVEKILQEISSDLYVVSRTTSYEDFNKAIEEVENNIRILCDYYHLENKIYRFITICLFWAFGD